MHSNEVTEKSNHISLKILLEKVHGCNDLPSNMQGLLLPTMMSI